MIRRRSLKFKGIFHRMQVEFKVLERAQEKTVKLKEIRETIL